MQTNKVKWKALSARIYDIGILALEPLQDGAAKISDEFKSGLERLGR